MKRKNQLHIVDQILKDSRSHAPYLWTYNDTTNALAWIDNACDDNNNYYNDNNDNNNNNKNNKNNNNKNNNNNNNVAKTTTGEEEGEGEGEGEGDDDVTDSILLQDQQQVQNKDENAAAAAAAGVVVGSEKKEGDVVVFFEGRGGGIGIGGAAAADVNKDDDNNDFARKKETTTTTINDDDDDDNHVSKKQSGERMKNSEKFPNDDEGSKQCEKTKRELLWNLLSSRGSASALHHRHNNGLYKYRRRSKKTVAYYNRPCTKKNKSNIATKTATTKDRRIEKEEESMLFLRSIVEGYFALPSCQSNFRSSSSCDSTAFGGGRKRRKRERERESSLELESDVVTVIGDDAKEDTENKRRHDVGSDGMVEDEHVLEGKKASSSNINNADVESTTTIATTTTKTRKILQCTSSSFSSSSSRGKVLPLHVDITDASDSSRSQDVPANDLDNGDHSSKKKKKEGGQWGKEASQQPQHDGGGGGDYQLDDCPLVRDLVRVALSRRLTGRLYDIHSSSSSSSSLSLFSPDTAVVVESATATEMELRYFGHADTAVRLAYASKLFDCLLELDKLDKAESGHFRGDGFDEDDDDDDKGEERSKCRQQPHGEKLAEDNVFRFDKRKKTCKSSSSNKTNSGTSSSSKLKDFLQTLNLLAARNIQVREVQVLMLLEPVRRLRQKHLQPPLRGKNHLLNKEGTIRSTTSTIRPISTEEINQACSSRPCILLCNLLMVGGDSSSEEEEEVVMMKRSGHHSKKNNNNNSYKKKKKRNQKKNNIWSLPSPLLNAACRRYTTLAKAYVRHLIEEVENVHEGGYPANVAERIFRRGASASSLTSSTLSSSSNVKKKSDAPHCGSGGKRRNQSAGDKNDRQAELIGRIQTLLMSADDHDRGGENICSLVKGILEERKKI